MMGIAVDLHFLLIKNKIFGMVSTMVCRSGQSMLFTHY